MLKSFLIDGHYFIESTMNKKLIVRLSEKERQDLTNLVRKGKVAAYRKLTLKYSC